VDYECQGGGSFAEDNCDKETGMVFSFKYGCLFEGANCVEGVDYNYEYRPHESTLVDSHREWHRGSFDKTTGEWRIELEYRAIRPPSTVFTAKENVALVSEN
jgi:hypothetical protein